MGGHPEPLRTFVEVLRDNAVYTDHAHRFVRMDGSEREVSFPDLWRIACQRAHRFAELGLRKGDRVAMILPETDGFVLSFIGALTAGLVPVPMYPPLSLAKLEAYGETVRHILRSSGAKALVTVPGLRDMLAKHLVSAAEAPVEVIVEESLAGEPMACPHPPCEIGPDDLALLQFTSGSTRAPAGVMVSHANLSANAHAIVFDGLRARADERALSWLPLYHDMGLIGFVIAPIFAQLETMFLPTMTFIRRPHTWLEAIDQFRAAITFAPNFAYELAVRAITPAQSESWDLSCLKCLGCGAEPIQPDTLEAFVQRFAAQGLKATAMLPCYGLAESTLAVSFAELDAEMKSVSVCPEALGQRRAVAPNGHGARRLVSCGRAFPGHAIRVVDGEGTVLPDDHVGHIQLRGPSVTAGYFRAPEDTGAIFADGWLRTGDLGFLRNGELFVCGRAKDLIILNGRNHYPQDIERVAAEAYGVRPDQVVAFGRPDERGVEQCVVVGERLKGAMDEMEARRLVLGRVRRELGVVVAEIVFIDRNTMPKTSSGKVRRRKTKAALAAGRLEGIGRAPRAGSPRTESPSRQQATSPRPAEVT